MPQCQGSNDVPEPIKYCDIMILCLGPFLGQWKKVNFGLACKLIIYAYLGITLSLQLSPVCANAFWDINLQTWTD